METKVANLNSKKATSAFICILSIFRRPRSLPLIHSFIERWGLRQIGTKTSKDKGSNQNFVNEKDSAITHRAVNELLHLIATNAADKNKIISPVGVVSQNHEGGIVWLFREVYEATYGALTENIHRNTWITELEKDFDQWRPLCSTAIMDGCLNIIWHLFAARAYYVDIFLATQDIKAFLEYLYHRVSAIRIITLLITIIDQAIKENKENKENKDNGETIWKDLQEHCDRLPKDSFLHIHEEESKNSFVQAILTLGVFNPIKQDVEKNLEGLKDISMLLEYLIRLRKNSLSTLLMALNKNNLLLRIEAAPNTVLAWSDQFLSLELDNMETVEKIDKDKKNTIDDSNDSAKLIIKELRKLFSNYSA